MLVVGVFCMPMLALAQEVPAADLQISDLFSMLLKAVGDFKSLGWQAGLSALVMILIASMKVSLLRQYVWDKLGWFKVFVAPVLSLVVVFIGLFLTGQPFTMQAFVVAMVTGAGAVALNEMLDGVKNAPGVNSVIVFVANLLKSLLPAKK